MVLLEGLVHLGVNDAVLELEVEEFVGAHGVAQLACYLAPAHGLRNGDLCLFAAAAPLGGDEDDTVGRTRTVDRGGRCVLEHRHALNVVRAEHLQNAGAGGRTVDDDEGGCAGRERTDTADVHAHCAEGADVASVGEHLQTRYLALQSVGHVGHGLGCHHVAIDALDRTHHGAHLTSRTVTYDHGLAKFVFLEHYLHVASHADGAGLHAEVRHADFLRRRRHALQGETSLRVSGGLDFCARHVHHGTFYGCALHVGHTTCHTLLCRGTGHGEQHAGPEER